MDAVNDSSEQCFHLVLIDARDQIPRNFPTISINHFHIRIITSACDWGGAGVKFFQIATTDTSGGHDLGKFCLGFFWGSVHGDSDNTLFAFQHNFLFRISASSHQTVVVNVGKTQLNPKKLLKSKWTAVEARDKEKHSLVTKVIDPEKPKHLIESAVIEAVLTRIGNHGIVADVTHGSITLKMPVDLSGRPIDSELIKNTFT